MMRLCSAARPLGRGAARGGWLSMMRLSCSAAATRPPLGDEILELAQHATLVVLTRHEAIERVQNGIVLRGAQGDDLLLMVVRLRCHKRAEQPWHDPKSWKPPTSSSEQKKWEEKGGARKIEKEDRNSVQDEQGRYKTKLVWESCKWTEAVDDEGTARGKKQGKGFIEREPSEQNVPGRPAKAPTAPNSYGGWDAAYEIGQDVSEIQFLEQNASRRRVKLVLHTPHKMLEVGHEDHAFKGNETIVPEMPAEWMHQQALKLELRRSQDEKGVGANGNGNGNGAPNKGAQAMAGNMLGRRLRLRRN